MSDTTTNSKRQGLAVDYVVPPFSLLDARSGRWQERKRRWIEYGIRENETTRNGLTFGASREFGDASKAMRSQTSEFDPVLAEVLVHWFSNPGDLVVDPFCGGPVRGVVATAMGRRYFGFDIRPDQVEANRRSFPAISEVWHSGAAQSDPFPALSPGMILTCPPYGRLERYSEDPSDLSNMGRVEFARAFESAIRGPASRLRVGGFCVVVIGDYRESGRSWGLPRSVEAALDSVGLALHAKMVLATRAGSAAIRARSQMEASRTPVACHQEVLVFVNGTPSPWTGSRPIDLVRQRGLFDQESA